MLFRSEEAQNAIIRKSGCLETQGTLTMVTNTGEYALASDCLEVRSVEYSTGSTTYPLIFLSQRKLATMKKNWKDDTGKPVNWTDVIFSSSVITIYPKPSSAYNESTVTYNYIQKVSTHTTYGDFTEIFKGRPSLEPYRDLIAYYVARLCMIDNRDWAESSNFKALYDEGLALLVMELNSSTVERQIRRGAPAAPVAQ